MDTKENKQDKAAKEQRPLPAKELWPDRLEHPPRKDKGPARAGLTHPKSGVPTV